MTARPRSRRPALAALALAVLLAAPATAAAQITTGLRAPAPRPTAEQRAARDSTIVSYRDSIAEAERLDMRAWVDSAAESLARGGAPVSEMPPEVQADSLLPRTPVPAVPGAARPAVGPDSGRVAPPAGPVVERDPRAPEDRPSPAERTTTPRGAPAPATPPPSAPGVRDGAPAPDTATPLPLLAALGAGLTAAGLLLKRR